MLQALKAAFFLRWPVRGLGSVPVNVLGLTCLGILGLANPGFWLLGVGLETAYLTTLATNPRFVRWAEAQSRAVADGSVEEKRQALEQQLEGDDRRAMNRLTAECARIVALWKSAESDEFLMDANEAALRDLQWNYLKLLLARQHLRSPNADADAAKVHENLAALERELADPSLTPATRESKTATLAILKRRVENLGRRQQTLAEIDSDLERIDAQVQLVLENTMLDRKPPAVAMTVDLASQTLDAGFFGSSADTIADVDAAYARPAAAAQKEQA